MQKLFDLKNNKVLIEALINLIVLIGSPLGIETLPTKGWLHTNIVYPARSRTGQIYRLRSSALPSLTPLLGGCGLAHFFGGVGSGIIRSLSYGSSELGRFK